MSKEIYISTTPHETRLAIVEDEQLAEIYYERENEYTLAGSIYNGKVTRVLPGMQSAFVDVGLERDAFLYVTDFMEEQGDAAEFEADGPLRSRAQQSTREGVAEPQGGGGERRPSSGKQERGGRRDLPRPTAEPVRPAETISFDEPIAPHPVDDAAGDPDGQGSRRWRGRRGRRRGRGTGRDAAPASSGEVAAEQTVETAEDASAFEELPASLDSLEASAIEIDLGAQIQPPQQRGRDVSRGRERGGRGDRGRRDSRDSRSDREPQPAPAYAYGDESEEPIPTGAPVLLPGESIRKYRDPAEVAAEDEARRASAPPFETIVASAPSLEVVGWDGGAVLPGETLSRHRGRPQANDRSASLSRLADLPGYRNQPASFTETEGALTSAEAASGDATGQRRAQTEGAAGPTLPTAILDVEDLPPASAPEETGGLTQHPAFHSAEATPAAQPLPEEYEPAEGEGVSLDLPSGQTYLKAELVSAEPAISAEAADLASNFLPLEHDQTVYDLSPAVEGESYGAPAAIPHEHDFTALRSTGEMLSEQIAPEAEPRLPSQEEAGTTNPVSAEQAIESVSLANAESYPLPIALDPSGPGEQILPNLHAYGEGDLQEEEIDGDEYEFDSALAGLDELEMGEYEEETLDDSADVGSMLHEMAGDHEADSVGEEEELPAYQSAAGDFTVEDFGGEPDEEDSVAEPSIGSGSGDQRSRRDSQPRRGSRDRRPGQRGNDRGGDRGRGGRKSMQTTDMPAINDLLKPGQEILVQIAKEPIAKKGARITSHIALPGRFLVFMPTVNHTGVSRKISSEEERRRLKSVLLSEKGDATGGFIVRTAAEGASEEELRNDLRFLIHLWDDIKARSEGSKSPALIYHDLNLIERILRDQVTDNFSAIWVDTEAEYERVLRFLQRFQPSLVRRVKLYTKETPLFEHFSVTVEIEKALKSKVWLKSGGSIVINQTEALVAIDINTGKYVGKTARLEDTILKTNLDAIPEIVRQIRLRDLGGIIVLDFIDMDERKNRAKVLQALEDELKSDRAPSKVLPFNDFGLVIMTRKRVKQSLERTLCIPDPVTEGTGMIKSPITVANEIFIEMRRMHRHIEKADIMLRVHPEVVKQLKSNGGKRLQELEEMTRKTILVKSDPVLNPEQFDIH